MLDFFNFRSVFRYLVDYFSSKSIKIISLFVYSVAFDHLELCYCDATFTVWFARFYLLVFLLEDDVGVHVLTLDDVMHILFWEKLSLVLYKYK